MRYLNEVDIQKIGVDWTSIANILEYTTDECLSRGDFAQPIKPYLRFGDKKNRVIAMPAYVGGKIDLFGIKWISSFPDNVPRGLNRAHSVVILNDTTSGIPIGILNSGSVSAIRTAGVTGMILRKYLVGRSFPQIKIGITGMGIIGRHHLKMLFSILSSIDIQILIFDIKPVDLSSFSPNEQSRITVVQKWEEAYTTSDIFITTTCSAHRYIDKQPKPGSLHLNISLRDYKAEVFKWFKDQIMVDDWDEICRENTDIERFHIEKGLQRSQVKTIVDLSKPSCFSPAVEEQAFMFNPMGLAVYDIAISDHYLNCATNMEIGTVLRN